MIEIEGLSKSFGNKVALQDINLLVSEGQFLTIFGPNGAGKTTLLRVLATLSKPTSGTARLAGLDLGHGAVEIRRNIGLVSHQTFLYDDLTAAENLRFYGRMYNVPELESRVKELVNQVGLSHRLHDPVRTYSRGMQQRLAIARAIIHNPPILLLDEPYTGLDQQATGMLRGVLSDLAIQGRTVIMTTHNLEQGLALCHQVAILANGRLVYHEAKGNIAIERFAETYYRYTTTPH
ncbi:MAG: heme ABC exporter ATP-binding protein CcmA [Anaerolineae bacterium]